MSLRGGLGEGATGVRGGDTAQNASADSHLPQLRMWFRGVAVVKADDALFLDSDMMLDAEQWKIVLKVYAGHPTSALTLAYQLIAIKQSLQRGNKGIPDAIAGLDLAIEGLYSHTDFHKMAHKFYHLTIEGTLKPKQEERLRELGVKL